MPIIPNQQRSLDSNADHRFSNSINRFTRLLTGGKNVILPYDQSGSVFSIEAYLPNSRSIDPHPYDTDRDFIISADELAAATVDYGQALITLDELNRVTELYDAGGYHFSTETPDGFDIDTERSDDFWPYDYDEDYKIGTDDMATITTAFNNNTITVIDYLKALQFQRHSGYHTNSLSVYADSSNFVAGPPEGDNPTNLFDINGDWRISYEELQYAQRAYDESLIDISALLRIIQFYNLGGYHDDTSGEDGYEVGPVPARSIIIGPGLIVKDDTFVHVKSSVRVDLTDTDNYIGDDSDYYGLNRQALQTGATSDDKMFMVLAKFVYNRTSTAPELAYVIANNRAAYLNNKNDYVYLGSFTVELLDGFNYLGVNKIYSEDTDELNSDASIIRPLYSPIIPAIDGGIIDSLGVVGPGGEISV